MTALQITTRKDLYRQFRSLSDSDAQQVLAFIDDLKKHEPNEETIQALEESRDPTKRKGPFKNAKELMTSLLKDDDV